MWDRNPDRALLAQSKSTNVKSRNKQLYDANLLNDSEQERLHEGEDAPRRSHIQRESEGYRQKDEGGPSPYPLPPQRSRSWYKTRNGIIITVVVILVVLGAVIGGTVEGTRARGKSSNRNNESTSISSAPVANTSSTSSNGGTGSSTPSMTVPGLTSTFASSFSTFHSFTINRSSTTGTREIVTKTVVVKVPPASATIIASKRN